MSDRQIQVGDLVVVVKPTACCGSITAIGKTYVVSNFGDIAQCFDCKAEYEGKVAFVDGMPVVQPIYRLKRIPPLSELEDAQTQEKLHAPVNHELAH